MILAIIKIAAIGTFYLTGLSVVLWAVFRFTKRDTMFKCTTKPVSIKGITDTKNQKNLIFPNFK